MGRLPADSFVLSFGGRGRSFARLPGCIIGRKQVIFVHPLWDCNRPTGLLAEAVADADQNGDIRFLDTFNVVRRLSFAYQALSLTKVGRRYSDRDSPEGN
jgi:DEAD/DEAH box helicase domain-containing protein